MCHLELIFIAPRAFWWDNQQLWMEEEEETSKVGQTSSPNFIWKVRERILGNSMSSLFLWKIHTIRKSFLVFKDSAPHMKTTVRILIRSHSLWLVFLLMQFISFVLHRTVFHLHLDHNMSPWQGPSLRPPHPANVISLKTRDTYGGCLNWFQQRQDKELFFTYPPSQHRPTKLWSWYSITYLIIFDQKL